MLENAHSQTITWHNSLKQVPNIEPETWIWENFPLLILQGTDAGGTGYEIRYESHSSSYDQVEIVLIHRDENGKEASIAGMPIDMLRSESPSSRTILDTLDRQTRGQSPHSPFIALLSRIAELHSTRPHSFRTDDPRGAKLISGYMLHHLGLLAPPKGDLSWSAFEIGYDLAKLSGFPVPDHQQDVEPGYDTDSLVNTYEPAYLEFDPAWEQPSER